MAFTDVYKQITDTIIAQLEAGVVPWVKPWVAGSALNLKTGKPYRGINVMILAMQPFSSPYWLTFNQARALGGSVRKGQHGTQIVLWKTFTKEDEEGDEKTFPVLRTYTVFNVEQCDGLDYPKENDRKFNPIQVAEDVIKTMKQRPGFTHLGGGRAYYDPARDCVNLPKKETFKSDAAYYATAFHELVHSTGHASRLARPGVTNIDRFGSEQYAQEELVAEMGAAMICGSLGIEREIIDNSAAYVAGWLQALRNDRRLVITAASAAQKAADWIMGTTFAVSEEEAA